MNEIKTFRLLAVLCALLLLVAGALFAHSGIRESRLSNETKAAYARYDIAVRQCEADSRSIGCAHANRQREVLSDLRDERAENWANGEHALWAMLVPAVVYLLFILVRFALTSRTRPLWPWKLDEEKVAGSGPGV